MDDTKDILEITETTAKNLYDLLLKLATRIKELEVENAELKQQLYTKPE